MSYLKQSHKCTPSPVNFFFFFKIFSIFFFCLFIHRENIFQSNFKKNILKSNFSKLNIFDQVSYIVLVTLKNRRDFEVICDKNYLQHNVVCGTSTWRVVNRGSVFVFFDIKTFLLFFLLNLLSNLLELTLLSLVNALLNFQHLKIIILEIESKCTPPVIF